MRILGPNFNLHRLLGVSGFSIAVILVLSVPSFAVYYNLGMFWKGTAGSSVPPFTERKIAVGDGHSCAIISDGTVKCWGENADGELGDGTTTQRTTPVTVSGLSGAVSVDVKNVSTCAALSDGTAKCWGGNGNGQLGDGTTTQRNTPVAVSGLSDVVSIANGDYHSCAALSDGTAKCWGWNAQGQLGDGTTTQRTTPVAVSGLSGVISISAGNNSTCAVLSDGTAKCWGANPNGKLGDGTTTQRNTPVAVSGLSGVVSISTKSYSDSCAVLSDGTAKCWGYNLYGQIGDGTTTQRTTPVTVSGLTGAVSIAVGGNNFACATLSDGTAKCWGRNNLGQLGDGTTTNRSTPVTVSGLAAGVSITAGDSHGCSALSDGTVKCWGYNYFGQLGNGTTTNSSTYVSVTGSSSGPFTDVLEDIVSISTGDYHSCAALSDGTAKCWGYNNKNQLGDGTTTNRSTPVIVSGLSGVVSIGAAFNHSCALLSDGTVKCWGENSYSQLGDGTTTNRSTPVIVSGLNTAVLMMTGSNHSCTLLSDGTVKCWGENSYSQLGDGTTTNRSTPVTVTGLSGVVSIEGGSGYSCAILSDGTAKCWGYNASGQLGDGTTTNRSTPVTVSGLSGVASISVGMGHSCAILSSGISKCWGYNAEGQLGDGTTTNRNTPVTVSGLSGVVSIGAGFNHSCAILSDGTAKCWGINGVIGMLGDGTTTNRYTPVSVTGLSDATLIATGINFGCAIISDGTAECWGSNTHGQLGNGTEVKSLVAAVVSTVNHIFVRDSTIADNATGAGTLVISKPSNTSTDNVMLAGITTRPSSTTITPPSGWTLLESQATGNVTQSTYYRVATAADTSVTDYTWTLSVSAKASGVIITYANVDPPNPVIASDGLAATSTTITAPTLTTSETEFQSVTFYGIASDGAITGPGGYSTVNEATSSGGGGGTTKVRTLVSDKKYTTSGATGAITATGPSIDNVGQHVLLKRAP